MRKILPANIDVLCKVILLVASRTQSACEVGVSVIISVDCAIAGYAMQALIVWTWSVWFLCLSKCNVENMDI